ncbi:MAG TPA: hypothetical protein VFL07_06750, partial [Rudaea sp.]|nr:hypothetical protein [Rudaea sp.]
MRAPERYAADRRDRFERFLAAICLIDDLAHLDDFEEALARSAQAYRSGIRTGRRAVGALTVIRIAEKQRVQRARH